MRRGERPALDVSPLCDLSDKVEGRISATLKAKTEAAQGKGEVVPLRRPAS